MNFTNKLEREKNSCLKETYFIVQNIALIEIKGAPDLTGAHLREQPTK